jgi:hypothetical protein
MNYKIIEKAGKFSVMEKPTEQSVGKFENREEAREFLRHLNFGGGFDGWTPTFMMKKYFFDKGGKVVLSV